MDQETYIYSQPTPETPPNDYQVPVPNGLATAALVLGIVSLVLSCCLSMGIPLGALGILFAILSKGGASQMSSRAKTGLGLSIGGLCLTILLVIASIAMTGFSQFVEQYNNYSEYYYPEQSGWDDDDSPDSYYVPRDQL